MEIKNRKRVLGNAFSLTALIFWVLYFILFLIYPIGFPLLNSILYLVLGAGSLLGTSLTLLFVGGGLVVYILSWLLGYTLGWSIGLYNKQELKKANIEKSNQVGVGTHARTT